MKPFLLFINLIGIPAQFSILLFLYSCNWYTHKHNFSKSLESAAYFTFDVIIEPRQLKNWFWIEPFNLIDIIRDKDYQNAWLISYKQSEGNDGNQMVNYNIFWEEVEQSDNGAHNIGMRSYKWRFSADSMAFLADFVVYQNDYDLNKSRMIVYYEIKGENLWWNAANKLAQYELNKKVETMFGRLVGIVEEQWKKKLEWEKNAEEGRKPENIAKAKNKNFPDGIGKVINLSA